MMNETGSLSTNANAAAAEPWQRHNGRLSATDRPFVIDSEPPQSETKFEDVVDQVTPCCLINIDRAAKRAPNNAASLKYLKSATTLTTVRRSGRQAISKVLFYLFPDKLLLACLD